MVYTFQKCSCYTLGSDGDDSESEEFSAPKLIKYNPMPVPFAAPRPMVKPRDLVYLSWMQQYKAVTMLTALLKREKLAANHPKSIERNNEMMIKFNMIYAEIYFVELELQDSINDAEDEDMKFVSDYSVHVAVYHCVQMENIEARIDQFRYLEMVTIRYNEYGKNCYKIFVNHLKSLGFSKNIIKIILSLEITEGEISSEEYYRSAYKPETSLKSQITSILNQMLFLANEEIEERRRSDYENVKILPIRCMHSARDSAPRYYSSP